MHCKNDLYLPLLIHIPIVIKLLILKTLHSLSIIITIVTGHSFSSFADEPRHALAYPLRLFG